MKPGLASFKRKSDPVLIYDHGGLKDRMVIAIC